VDRQLREITKVYRFSPFKTLRTLILPTVAPYWISACRTALGLAWKAGVAAEIIAMPPDTIGKMIGEAKIYILTEEVFAWTLTIILLSILIEFVFSALLNQLLKKMSHTGGVSHADI
jgi:NitT/TauT family transport system permease protein